MAKVKMICFDMDGTVADLYGVNGWLEMLREENARPYELAKPMWNMAELNEVLRELQKQGIEIRIITWLSMNSSEEYKEKTRQAKIEWLEKQGFPFNNFHGVAYGTTKANAIRKYLELGEQAILIDDNAKVRQGWNMGETIDPTTQNIIEILKTLIQSRLLVYKKNKKKFFRKTIDKWLGLCYNNNGKRERAKVVALKTNSQTNKREVNENDSK